MTVEESNENVQVKFHPSSLVWIASIISWTSTLNYGIVIGYHAASIDSLKEWTQVRVDNSTGNQTSEVISGSIDWNEGDYESWFASIVAIGSMFGSLASGPVLAILGPKRTVTVSHIPFLIGWIMIIFGTSIPVLIIGRFLSGFSVGFCNGPVAIYTMEISTPEIRGILGISSSTVGDFGILLAALLAFELRYDHVAIISAIISILGPTIMLFMPESPVFLYSKYTRTQSHEDWEAVTSSLSKLRKSGSNISREIESIENTASNRVKQKLWLSLNEVKQVKVYKPMAMALGLSFLQQCTGVNAVLFYNHYIFKESGYELPVSIVVILTGLVMTSFCFIGSLIIDRFGRKKLLLYTGIILLISLLTLSLYFQFKPSDDDTVHLNSTYLVNGKLYENDTLYGNDKSHSSEYGSKYGIIALLSMLTFMGVFMIAFGPVPWLMVPEMSPYFARPFITASSVSVNRLIVFIITQYFISLTQIIGFHGCFYLFAVNTFLSLIFIKFFLPETKGKTMEELDKLFD